MDYLGGEFWPTYRPSLDTSFATVRSSYNSVLQQIQQSCQAKNYGWFVCDGCVLIVWRLKLTVARYDR